jgi:tungstate transport system permease protein
MEYIIEGILKAFHLILSFDSEIYGIVGRSVRFAAIATFFATVIGVPIGFIIASNTFRGKTLLLIALNTSMAFPTVVIGLLGYTFLSRQAPLGFLGLIFTPRAVIIGEFLISLPIITNLTVSAIQSVDKRVYMTAKTLGAGPETVVWSVLIEARYAIFAAIIAGLGRAVSEVGSAMMLGGNIRFYTRTMTTSIAMEVSKGEFSFGLALGFFLLTVAFTINILFHYLQVKEK